MDLAERYHLRPAAAYARAALGIVTAEDEADVRRGLDAGLDLHRFKRTRGLPRVARVLGLLRALAPASALDVGGGRGVFLWPLLEALPELAVTAVDRDPRAVHVAAAVRRGGLSALTALCADATALPFAARTFEVVTLLEVLEHVPEVERAAAEAMRVARRFVVASVPSHPDDNPQHLRLFSDESLVALLRAAGAMSVRCQHVLNHTIAAARVSS